MLEAENGRIGVEIARQHIPDLIISDVMMPEMDGFEACEIIKTDPKTDHIPLILLTAKAGIESRLTGLKTGADDYLVKPFNVEELNIRIDNLIRIRKILQERYRSQLAMEPEQQVVATPQDAFLKQVTEIVQANFTEEQFNLEKLYDETGMSRAQFYRKFQSLTGQSPAAYLRETRLRHAHQLLKDSELQIAEVAYQSGFGNPVTFNRAFNSHYGYAPTEARGAEH